MPEDVRFGGGGFRDVAWPKEENDKRGGFTHIIQLYVCMERNKLSVRIHGLVVIVIECGQKGVEFESC